MNSKILFLIIIPLLFIYCKENDSASTSSSKKEIVQFKLPHQLKEISGICFSKEGKLFGHNDEQGIIFQIDPSNGELIKLFQIGKIGVEADFEDIAIVEDKFFLITSSGILFEFEEGSNLEKVEFNKIDLNFSSKFNIEGMCYDRIKNELLIASKEYAGKHNEESRAVYSYSLKTQKIKKTPRFLISLKELKKEFDIKDFYPSAITQIPSTDNFYILSAKGEPAIIKINSSGKILAAKKLNPKKHSQPEGIAINNSDMYICDEGSGKSGMLTVYKNYNNDFFKTND